MRGAILRWIIMGSSTECQPLTSNRCCVVGAHVMGVVGYEGNDGAKKRVAFVEIVVVYQEGGKKCTASGICNKDLQISI